MTAKLENLKDLDLDWWKSVDFYVTKSIVCVQGRDPLTFLSCPFSFLIGWEFYGPNYLKCLKFVRGACCVLFPPVSLQ